MQDPRAELAGYLVILSVTIFALLLSGTIDMDFASDLEVFAGPRRYPRIILSVILVLDLILIASALRRLSAGNRVRGAVADANWRGKGKAFAVFVALAAFVLLFKPVGYLLAMFPLLIFVALMNGARNIGRTVLVCSALILICLLVFRYGLNIVLPEGLVGIDMIF